MHFYKPDALPVIQTDSVKTLKETQLTDIKKIGQDNLVKNCGYANLLSIMLRDSQAWLLILLTTIDSATPATLATITIVCSQMNGGLLIMPVGGRSTLKVGG